MTSERRCPACGRRFQPDQSEVLPFCSDRCRAIDLGCWLDERYGLPVERAEEPEDPQQDAADH
jgi:endogenous inhibitor of DNA gyrase (YacG/DUF329 family)